MHRALQTLLVTVDNICFHFNPNCLFLAGEPCEMMVTARAASHHQPYLISSDVVSQTTFPLKLIPYPPYESHDHQKQWLDATIPGNQQESKSEGPGLARSLQPKNKRPDKYAEGASRHCGPIF